MDSRRQYLSFAELTQFANITISDSVEAADRISQAEEIIDSYLGYQNKFIEREIYGEVSAATATTLTDATSNTRVNIQNDYFTFCEIEILGGDTAGQAGQRRIITKSDRDTLTLTVDSAWTVTPDSTCAYKIYQLGKMPRVKDVYINPATTKYYKSIPEAIKRATAAQVEYMIQQGDKFFSTDASDVNIERIGNFQYQKDTTLSGFARMIAPKARALLRGFRNVTGRVENTSESFM